MKYSNDIKFNNDTPEDFSIKSCNNFTEYLNVFENNDEFDNLYDDEMNNLDKMNIHIFFVKSNHYLAKGIGGKRGLINYFNNLLIEEYLNLLKKKDINLSDENYFKNNFNVMQLDDNITAFHDLHDKCTYTNASVKICDDEIIKCTTKKDVSEVISKKTETNKYLNQNCYHLSIFYIYDVLKTLSNVYNYLISGIRKGHGDRLSGKERQDKSIFALNNSYALYKLTIQKPHMLHNYGYYYNPYNSRFMEDISFNALPYLMDKSAKFGNFFLRFGHYYDEKITEPDYEDCFCKEIIAEKTPIKPIFGNYFVLYYYLHVLNNCELLFLNNSESPFSYNLKALDKNVEIIKPSSKNKYGWMHMILYILINYNFFYHYWPELSSNFKVTQLKNLVTQELDIFAQINNETKGANLLIATNLNRYNSEYENFKKSVAELLKFYYEVIIKHMTEENYKKHLQEQIDKPKEQKRKKGVKRSRDNKYINYEIKYIKYKIKYLNLKKKLNL